MSLFILLEATDATLESRSGWDRWELAGVGWNQQWVRKRERLGGVGGGTGSGTGKGLGCAGRFIKLVSVRNGRGIEGMCDV